MPRSLISEIVCPYCWTTFPPEKVLWLAESSELIGDYKLGETHPLRFLPTEFSADGFALDARGNVCRQIACPHCHLRLPASALETPAYFMSIVGAPSSGKSYYLAASTTKLRDTLQNRFQIGFNDADVRLNAMLRHYEALYNGNIDKQTANQYDQLPKTETDGVLYNTVRQGDENVRYPSPFVFLATKNREGGENTDSVVAINLYDNAGEHWLPAEGADSASNPVTRHVAKSRCIFFVFDPTQEARFRRACRAVSNDPQLGADAARNDDQDAVLTETINRVRLYRQMTVGQKYDRPLIVVVSKFDVWQNLTPTLDLTASPVGRITNPDGSRRYLLLVDQIRRVSAVVRETLRAYAPRIPNIAESFAGDNVIYIPTSATGIAPVRNLEQGQVGFLAEDLRPLWVDVPMLYALSRLTRAVPCRE